MRTHTIPLLVVSAIALSIAGCQQEPDDAMKAIQTPIPAELPKTDTALAPKASGGGKAGLSPPVHFNPGAKPLEKVIGSKMK